MTKVNIMTDKQEVLDALNQAFSQKYLSLAHYILEAQPYVREGEEPLLSALAVTAAEDKRLADRLAEIIQELEGIPQIATYSPDVANLNYLALGYLAGLLIQTLEEQLVHYQQSLELARETKPAWEAFEELCRVTGGQLERLRALHKAA